jgi:exo-beta-1,3-glucanase (GH17 family)
MTLKALLLAAALVTCLPTSLRAENPADSAEKAADSAFVVRPLVIPDPAPGQGWGVCYGPFRDGQHPNTGPHPTREQIREDLHIMAKHWRMIRMYGVGDAARWTAEIIREDKLPVKLLAGVWIASEVRINDRNEVVERDEALAKLNREQVAEAIKLANEYPDVVMAVGVGNETQVAWSTYRTTPEVLLQYLREVRQHIKQPVTTCDDYNFWNKPESREIARNCDFIALHAYAMWNKQLLPDALPWTREQIAAVQSLHPDRRIVLTELGWATQKGTNGYQAIGIIADPGERPQELFYRALENWATQANQPYFYFSAFDEKWKGGDEPNEVEKHWGVFFSDRTPKLVMQSPAQTPVAAPATPAK